MSLIIFNFDGTGNEPEDAVQTVKNGRKEDDNITNILKFHLMCGGNLHTDELYGSSSRESVKKCFYYQGVGTYGSWWQRTINAGLAPRSKNVGTILTEAFEDFDKFYETGDQVIVTGFSRGAAIARMFCSKLSEEFPNKIDNENPFIYLGVFDTVASIGLPNLSRSERPDYDVVFEKGFSLSNNIKEATHMVSLDDKRKAFQPTLMNNEDKITEIWFAGAHSDVGGGYYHDGLSDVTLIYFLNWIAYQVKSNGLKNPKLAMCTQAELDNALPAKLQGKIGLDDIEIKANAFGENHQQDRWPLVDWLTLDDRVCCVIKNDQIAHGEKPIIHNSVITRIAEDKDYRPKSLRNVAHEVWYGFAQATEQGAGIKNYVNNPRPQWHVLEPGKSVSTTVFASELFSHSGILVEKDEVYKIEVNENDTWTDGSIECNADGWSTDNVDLGWKEYPIKLARRLKRVRGVDWFRLCACIGTDDDFAEGIGTNGTFKANRSGELTFFANDIKSKLDNNIGSVLVTVTRLT